MTEFFDIPLNTINQGLQTIKQLEPDCLYFRLYRRTHGPELLAIPEVFGSLGELNQRLGGMAGMRTSGYAFEAQKGMSCAVGLEADQDECVLWVGRAQHNGNWITKILHHDYYTIAEPFKQIQ